MLLQTRHPVLVIIQVYWLACVAAHQVNLPQHLVDGNESIALVKDGLSFGEGPASDSSGNLYFTDIQTERIWKVTLQGVSSIFRESSNKANGLVFDAQDRLLACERNQVTRTEHGGTITVLAQGDSLNEANDLTLVSDGSMFFTCPVWDGIGHLYHRSPQGVLKKLFSLTGFPNGVEYIEEKKILYVAMTQRNEVWKYYVDNPIDLTNKTVFAQPAMPDGFAVDEEGNLWMTANSESKVIVYDSTGDSLGHIVVDNASVQNCAFGGPDNKVLYIAAKTAIYKLQTKVKGRSTRGNIVVSVLHDPRQNEKSTWLTRRHGSGERLRRVRVYNLLGQVLITARTQGSESTGVSDGLAASATVFLKKEDREPKTHRMILAK